MAEWGFPAPLGTTSSVTSYPEPTGLLVTWPHGS